MEWDYFRNINDRWLLECILEKHYGDVSWTELAQDRVE